MQPGMGMWLLPSQPVSQSSPGIPEKPSKNWCSPSAGRSLEEDPNLLWSPPPPELPIGPQPCLGTERGDLSLTPPRSSDLCPQLPQSDLPGTSGAGAGEGLGMKAKGRGCGAEGLLQTPTKPACPSLWGLPFTLLPSLTLP